MELRQLKYFKEACELQNFSEAARVLHISQSTLSQQIKQLEDELDVLLFDRIGKRIVPTEAGLAFLPYAVRAIRDAENGKQIIRDLKGIETGVLYVGVTYSMSPLLIAALGLFSKTYPKIKVNVSFGTSEELLDRLEANQLDFVLSFKPEGVSEHLETMPLFSSMPLFYRALLSSVGKIIVHYFETAFRNSIDSAGKRICHSKKSRRPVPEASVGVDGRRGDERRAYHHSYLARRLLGNDIDAGGCTGRREPGTNSDTMCRQADFTRLFVLGTGRLP